MLQSSAVNDSLNNITRGRAKNNILMIRTLKIRRKTAIERSLTKTFFKTLMKCFSTTNIIKLLFLINFIFILKLFLTTFLSLPSPIQKV